MKQRIYQKAFVRKVVDRLAGTYLIHEVEDVLDAIKDELEDSWIDQDEIILAGFGSFITRKIHGHHVPSFVASRPLRDRVKKTIQEYYGE